jgi:hypothetical protein
MADVADDDLAALNAEADRLAQIVFKILCAPPRGT